MKYIATESKRAGKITAIDYFQKSTGIFNKNGMISQEELEQMKVRAQTGEKNLWHGFISVDEENSHKGSAYTSRLRRIISPTRFGLCKTERRI